MIIAVSGSSGFLGKRVVTSLLKKGHEVLEIDVSKGFDILDMEALKGLKSFDVFVHLAAKSFVPLSYKQPHEFYNLNINGVINGLELCRLNIAKFVFISSYVYGTPMYLPIDENHRLEGFNPYSESKIIGETICENYHKYFGVPSIILRPFNIYGTGQNDNFLIPLILNQAKMGKIRLLDPDPRRDFVYVDDVVYAIKLAVEDKKIDFEKFNIGSGKSFSVEQVVSFVNKIYGGLLDVSFEAKERKNEVLDTVADISKINLQLNWTPKTELFDGLKSMID
jgi:nucleoside-diphosphate-sugar epimerase